MPKYMTRVQQFREQLAWTKAKLARQAEVSLGTIARMETGLQTRKDRRLAVAKALGVPYPSVFPNESD